MKIEYKFYKGHVLKAKKWKILKSFVQFVIRLSFFKKLRRAFICGYFQYSLVSMSFMGQQRLHWCRFWFRTALMPQQFRMVRLRLEESICRGLLRGWVPRRGIPGAGRGALIVGVASIVGGLFAGALEGLVQRSDSSLQQ